MKVGKWSWVVPTIVLLAGCAAPGTVRLYDGEARQPAEVALISAPEQVQVMALDGVEPTGLLRQHSQSLELLPGEHVLTLRYVQLFQINASEHEVVRSRQAALRFTAVAGTEYRLEMDKQPSLDAARKFAKAPQFRLINNANETVGQSTAIKSYAEASLIDTITKAFESTQNSDAQTQAQTHLDLLKDVWGRATPDEREAFQLWLTQQPK
ncbi:MAG: DUF2057 domain-containing protein [Moraxellaceae bacterium]|nr:DUF2057 domain-containing protein [Moraxellaceae bacterium]MBP7229599.1 DUF2057 domain-containing protein [Moraxellaceae bacterium]MBP8852079.1 DUF2057 domain-containing protein [Moraxellaceae bacterium]MBP9729951.1 DUF2057 domain-containing protein [Moraxellaceae bacterium]